MEYALTSAQANRHREDADRQAVEGRTPEISVVDARRLRQSVSTTHVVGLRDRALIGILIYTAARVGAVARLRRGDFYSVAGIDPLQPPRRTKRSSTNC